MNDDKIIELYFSRSEAAIAETDKKYGESCRKTAFGILGDREDSEECVSDTYMKVWGVIPPKRPSRLGSFVLRIARNLALDMFRRRGSLRNGGGYCSVSFDEISEFLPSTQTVEKAAEQKAVLDAIESFLKGLSKEKRIMFVRRYFFCSTYADIADDLHTTEGNVTMTLRRTREKLREYLEKEGIDI